MKLKTIEITICEACLEGKGQECHTAGCAMWMHRVDIPFYKEQYKVLSEVDEWEPPQ